MALTPAQLEALRLQSIQGMQDISATQQDPHTYTNGQWTPISPQTTPTPPQLPAVVPPTSSTDPNRTKAAFEAAYGQGGQSAFAPQYGQGVGYAPGQPNIGTQQTGGGPLATGNVPLSPYAQGGQESGTDYSTWQDFIEFENPDALRNMYYDKYGLDPTRGQNKWQKYLAGQVDPMMTAWYANAFLTPDTQEPTNWAQFMNTYNPSRSRNLLSNAMGGLDQQGMADFQKMVSETRGAGGLGDISSAALQQTAGPLRDFFLGQMPEYEKAFQGTQEQFGGMSWLDWYLQRVGARQGIV